MKFKQRSRLCLHRKQVHGIFAESKNSQYKIENQPIMFAKHDKAGTVGDISMNSNKSLYSQMLDSKKGQHKNDSNEQIMELVKNVPLNDIASENEEEFDDQLMDEQVHEVDVNEHRSPDPRSSNPKLHNDEMLNILMMKAKRCQENKASQKEEIIPIDVNDFNPTLKSSMPQQPQNQEMHSEDSDEEIRSKASMKKYFEFEMYR